MATTKDIAIKVIKEEYPGISQQGIDALLANIEIETNFKNFVEIPQDYDKVMGNSDLKSMQANLSKLKGGKKAYDKLSDKEKLGVLYWGDKKAKYAGGIGGLQLTSAGYGGNQNFEQELNQIAQTLNMKPEDLYNQAKTDPEAAIRLSIVHLRDIKGVGVQEVNMSDGKTLRSQHINPHESQGVATQAQAARNNIFNKYSTGASATEEETERTGVVDDDIKDPLASRELANKYEQSKTAKKKFTKDEAADVKKRLRSLSLNFANDLEDRYGTFNMFEDQDDDDNRKEFLNLIAKEFDLENLDLSNLEELGRARATIQLVETTLDDREWVEEVGGSGFFDSLFEDMAKDWWTTDYSVHKELGVPRISDVPDAIRAEVEADPNLDQFKEIDERLWDESKREINPALLARAPITSGILKLLGVDSKAIQDYDFTGGSIDIFNITGEGGNVDEKWKSFIQKHPEAQKQYLEAKDITGGNLTVQQYLDKISSEDQKQQAVVDKIKKEGVTDQDRQDALQRHEDRVAGLMEEFSTEDEEVVDPNKKDELRKKRMRGAEKALSGLKAAAGVLSLSKALKDPEIDIPEISPLLMEAVDKQREMAKSGFSAQEKNAAMQGLNNAYAGAMKNVLRASGGQRGMYLANQGTVDANRIAGLNQLAAQDAALHRQNIQQYNQLASSVGQMKLNRDMTAEQMKQSAIAQNKQLMGGIGSNLVSDALSDLSWYMNPNRDLIEQATRTNLEGLTGEGKDNTVDTEQYDYTVGGNNFRGTQTDELKAQKAENERLRKLQKTV
jgi:hypothetical protein